VGVDRIVLPRQERGVEDMGERNAGGGLVTFASRGEALGITSLAGYKECRNGIRSWRRGELDSGRGNGKITVFQKVPSGTRGAKVPRKRFGFK